MRPTKIINLLLILGILVLVWMACSVRNDLPLQTTFPADLSTPDVQTFKATETLINQVLATSTSTPTETPLPTSTPAPTETPAFEGIRFAVIGDYGEGNQAEADVAALVKSWSPDFIITTGDNNYPSGAADTIDHRIGQHYHEFIFPYRGSYGEGADYLRFFPTLGNHDWDTNRAEAYFDYFELPGNERYYDFVLGPVHFFALNSDSREPDGVARNSVQAVWLQRGLVNSMSPWQFIFMHHPPFSSGPRGPVDWMRWPFRDWGADVVVSGHDHYYERLFVDGLPFFINGLGGGPIYAFGPIAPGSVFRYNADYGAMLIVADEQKITFQFINRQGDVVDTYELLAGR